jgi:hypothetical protein
MVDVGDDGDISQRHGVFDFQNSVVLNARVAQTSMARNAHIEAHDFVVCITLAHTSKLKGFKLMFEKNRASNASSAGTAIAARLILNSGEVLDGSVISHCTGRFQEVLNSSAAFVEFQNHQGQTRYFNKSAIVSLDPVNIPATDQLARRNPNSPVFDPYQVLGVRSDMPMTDIRTAYHELARAYHPDRFLTANLPTEVMQYLESMAQRVNLAWETVSRAQVAAE